MNDARRDALRTLHAEHRSMSAVLSALRELARMALDPDLRPDFAVFRAMVYYIDTFPEKLHHPKESEHLFARLLLRAPEAAALVARLEAEHVEGARRVRELERAVLAFEQTWPQGAAAFAAQVDDYAQFQWHHMRREEQELLPLAEQRLSPEDWAPIAEAFVENEDPVAGVAARETDQLFTRILRLAPAPVGIGKRWQRP